MSVSSKKRDALRYESVKAGMHKSKAAKAEKQATAAETVPAKPTVDDVEKTPVAGNKTTEAATAQPTAKNVDDRPIETLPVQENDEAPAEEVPKKPRRRRLKMHEVTAENDIKYRGPLSYRHLRILGWLSLAFAQAAVLMTIASNLDVWLAEQLAPYSSAFSFIGEFAVPLFLLANFAVILSAKDGYKKLFIIYGLLTSIIIGLYFLVCEHYIAGVITMMTGDRESAGVIVAQTVPVLFSGGHVGFNLFMDLLL